MGTADCPGVRQDLGSPIGTCTCPEHADAEARELILSMLRAGRHTEPEALTAALADCVVAPIIQRAKRAEAELSKRDADAAHNFQVQVREAERVAGILADRDATIAELRRQLEAESAAQALLRDERDRLREAAARALAARGRGGRRATC